MDPRVMSPNESVKFVFLDGNRVVAFNSLGQPINGRVFCTVGNHLFEACGELINVPIVIGGHKVFGVGNVKMLPECGQSPTSSSAASSASSAASSASSASVSSPPSMRFTGSEFVPLELAKKPAPAAQPSVPPPASVAPQPPLDVTAASAPAPPAPAPAAQPAQPSMIVKAASVPAPPAPAPAPAAQPALDVKAASVPAPPTPAAQPPASTTARSMLNYNAPPFPVPASFSAPAPASPPRYAPAMSKEDWPSLSPVTAAIAAAAAAHAEAVSARRKQAQQACAGSGSQQPTSSTSSTPRPTAPVSRAEAVREQHMGTALVQVNVEGTINRKVPTQDDPSFPMFPMFANPDTPDGPKGALAILLQKCDRIWAKQNGDKAYERTLIEDMAALNVSVKSWNIVWLDVSTLWVDVVLIGKQSSDFKAAMDVIARALVVGQNVKGPYGRSKFVEGTTCSLTMQPPKRL